MAGEAPSGASARGFEHRPGLDGLRAVAVIVVVAYHYVPHSAPGGFLGVDIFFVLSGYLIGGLLLAEAATRGRISLQQFWIRRAKRLLPALGLLLLGVCAYAAWLAPRDTLSRLRGDLVWTLGYVANWRFIFSKLSYFELFAIPSPLRHMWSLAIEEQFYLLFPLLAVGCLALGRRRDRFALRLGSVCAALAALSIVEMWLLTGSGDPSRAYYGTDTRAHALLIGVITACVLHGRRPTVRAGARAARQVVGVLAAVAVAVTVIRVHDSDLSMYRGGFALFAVAVALVIVATIEAGPLRALLSLPPLRAIGRVSYGVYLWHWPVQVVLDPVRTGVSGWRLQLLWVAVTLVCTDVSYGLIEMPARRMTVPAIRISATAFTGATALLLAVFVSTAGAVAPLAALNPTSSKPPSVSVVVPTVPTVPTSVPSPSTGPVTHPDITPHLLAVVGDSVAFTLTNGFAAKARADKIGLITFAQPGCGVATGAVAADGKPVPWSYGCAKVIPPSISAMIDKNRPDVVVVISTWETSDRIVNGHILANGTAAWRAEVLARLDDLYARLHKFGARIVFVDVVPSALSALRGATMDNTAANYNAVLVTFAQSHRDVGVAHFGAVLCPNGQPCPRTIDGVVPRPNDGGHFTDTTSVWAVQRLWPLLVAAWSGR